MIDISGLLTNSQEDMCSSLWLHDLTVIMSWSEFSFKQECSYRVCLIVAAHDPLVTATVLAEPRSPFKLGSAALLHFLDSKLNPRGPVKAGTIDSFHILIGKVTGFTEFLCALWAQRETASCRPRWCCHTGRVRARSDRPHFCKSNTSYVHVNSLTRCWQHKWFMFPAICLFCLPHRMHDIRATFTGSMQNAFYFEILDCCLAPKRGYKKVREKSLKLCII